MRIFPECAEKRQNPPIQHLQHPNYRAEKTPYCPSQFRIPKVPPLQYLFKISRKIAANKSSVANEASAISKMREIGGGHALQSEMPENMFPGCETHGLPQRNIGGKPDHRIS